MKTYLDLHQKETFVKLRDLIVSLKDTNKGLLIEGDLFLSITFLLCLNFIGGYLKLKG